MPRTLTPATRWRRSIATAGIAIIAITTIGIAPATARAVRTPSTIATTTARFSVRRTTPLAGAPPLLPVMIIISIVTAGLIAPLSGNGCRRREDMAGTNTQLLTRNTLLALLIAPRAYSKTAQRL